MNDKVIEPSEIIVDQRGLPREDTTRSNPWIRFLARFFDYSIFLAFLWGLRIALKGHFPLGSYEHLIPFEFFVWIPIEALFLMTWGKTPGKFFLKIELKQGRRTHFDFFTAMKRSFHVWFRGLGMGIPGLNFFCLLFAYHRLKLTSQTSWDREENITVLHRPVGQWRLIFAAVIAISTLFIYYNEKNQVIAKATSYGQ